MSKLRLRTLESTTRLIYKLDGYHRMLSFKNLTRESNGLQNWASCKLIYCNWSSLSVFVKVIVLLAAFAHSAPQNNGKYTHDPAGKDQLQWKFYEIIWPEISHKTLAMMYSLYNKLLTYRESFTNTDFIWSFKITLTMNKRLICVYFSFKVWFHYIDWSLISNKEKCQFWYSDLSRNIFY